MFEKRLFIKCDDHDVPMVIAYPDGKGPFPCILLLHGFMAYKEGDGYLFTKTAKEFAKAGIMSARIDFCSMGENRYSRIHYGMEICIKETKAAFHYLQSLPEIDSKRIGILGHSMGGRVAFLCCDLPSKCLISFNGAIDVDKIDDMNIKINLDELHTNGYTILHTSDGRYELVFPKFVEDLQICSDRIYKYTNPILVCVGANDPTLNPNISYNFIKKTNADSIVVENANHTFNAKTGDYTKVYELLSKVIPWLEKNL